MDNNIAPSPKPGRSAQGSQGGGQGGGQARKPGGKRVSIFVCGVQKAGTTTLDAYFCEHPKLTAAGYKELHFFDKESFDWSKPDYTELHRYFSRSVNGKLRFDITPEYSFWPNCIERIKAYNPNAKLIFLFRDPFDRAWSQWCMEYARKKENLLFDEAIREGRKRLDAVPPKSKQLREAYAYIERGQYAGQVRRALAHFPREQLLFLRFEDLIRDHTATLAVIAEFLKIPPFPSIKPQRKNPRRAITDGMKPTQADRDLIYDLLRDDVLEFAELTGLDVSNWPTVLRKPAE